MSALTANLTGLGILLIGMGVVWAYSVKARDASLVDRFWGLLFVALAIWWAAVGTADGPRTIILPVLVTIWGVRLAGYITWRNWGDEEDKRYQKMRAHNPDTFAVRSLFTIFWFQSLLAWLIAAPLFYPQFRPEAGDLNLLDAIGIVVWGVGLFFEAVGDWQLQRFLADPDNKGKVMDQGLWRYTRHPNYFGDVTVWVGYGIIGAASGAWWAFYGTALMAAFIIKVSGVAMTDRNMGKSGSKREGYDEYVRRTNTFFPGPPKD